MPEKKNKKKVVKDNEKTKIMSVEEIEKMSKDVNAVKHKKKNVSNDIKNNENVSDGKPRKKSNGKKIDNTENIPVNNKSKKKKKKKKKLKFKTVFYILLLIFITIILLAGVTLSRYINMIGRAETGTRSIISLSDNLLRSQGVKNILIVGTDGRNSSEAGRSDTIILLSLDEYNQEMNMVSFMRDMYVDIPNYGKDKINSAYSYGGASLLMDTIEENFGIKIDDYVTINFNAFAGIVDAVGGVEITLSDEEAQEVNNILRNEVNELMGDEKEADFLESGGTYRLNGKQALCYSRIRYVGDADFERTQRQREVLSRIISESKSINIFKLDKIMQETLPEITTNMSDIMLYECAVKIPVYLGYDIKQIRVPADGTWTYSEIDGSSVITLDFNDNIIMLAKELYGIEYNE